MLKSSKKLRKKITKYIITSDNDNENANKIVSGHLNIIFSTEFYLFSTGILSLMAQLDIRLFHEKEFMLSKNLLTRFEFFHMSATIHSLLFIACVIAIGLYTTRGILKIYQLINASNNQKKWNIAAEFLMFFLFLSGYALLGAYALSNAINEYKSAAQIQRYIHENTDINLWKSAKSKLIILAVSAVVLFLIFMFLHLSKFKKNNKNSNTFYSNGMMLLKLFIGFSLAGTLIAFLCFLPLQMVHSLKYVFVIAGVMTGLSVFIVSTVISLHRLEGHKKNCKKFPTRHPKLLIVIAISFGLLTISLISYQTPKDLTMDDSVKIMGIGLCLLIGGIVLKDIVEIVNDYLTRLCVDDNQGIIIEDKYKIFMELLLRSVLTLTILCCGAMTVELYLKNPGLLNKTQAHTMYWLLTTTIILTIVRVSILNFIKKQDGKAEIILNELQDQHENDSEIDEIQNDGSSDNSL